MHIDPHLQMRASMTRQERLVSDMFRNHGRVTPQITNAVEQSPEFEAPNKKRILIIFTGGTIGMSKDVDGVLKPSKGFLERTLANFTEVSKHTLMTRLLRALGSN